MKLDDALHLLLTDPRTLLDNAFLAQVGGSESSTSKAALFSISKPAAMQNAWKRAGSDAFIPAFQIKVRQEVSTLPRKFVEGTEECLSFSAFYVAMKRMAAVGSEPVGTYLVLPSSGGGSEICITSQLSGCTFGIGSQGPGGCCVVSHIQPVTSAATDQLEMAAQTQRLFGSAPRKLVEMGGAKDYADRANVIGQRQYGVWSFFLQSFMSGFARTILPVVDL